MDQYALDKFAIPIAVGVLSGLIVLILWRFNTKNSEKKKLYLPLLNEFCSSLSNLLELVNADYPNTLSKDNPTKLMEQNHTTAAFVNIPKNISAKLVHIQSMKKEYQVSLRKFLAALAPLEAKVNHRPYTGNPPQYYIAKFALLEDPPQGDILINFPQAGAGGGFHCLLCDSTIVQELYWEAKSSPALTEYVTIKGRFIAQIHSAINAIRNEQKV